MKPRWLQSKTRSLDLRLHQAFAAEQAIIQTLKTPCEVVVSDDVYGGTGRLFRKLFSQYGIHFHFVDMTDSP